MNINRLIATLKPQSNRPSYSNTVIDTVAVDGSAVSCYIWYSEEGTGRGMLPIIYCHIQLEGLLYDAERNLLAIAKFLVLLRKYRTNVGIPSSTNEV